MKDLNKFIQEKLVISKNTNLNRTKFKTLDEIPKISNTDLNTMMNPLFDISDSIKDSFKKNLQTHHKIGSDFIILAQRTKDKDLIPKWWYSVLLKLEDAYKAYQEELYYRLNLSEDIIFGFVKQRYEKVFAAVVNDKEDQKYTSRLDALTNYFESYNINIE